MFLQRILWDGHADIVNWTGKDFHEAYLYLKDLAIQGKIAIIIDGLGELGNFIPKDVSRNSETFQATGNNMHSKAKWFIWQHLDKVNDVSLCF